MSKSTPDDLAVAFRTLVRRRQEALESAEGAAVSGPIADLDNHISEAAALLGAAADPAAIADAIAAKRADDWDTRTLDELRRLATDAGTAIRRVADSAPPPDDDA